ncbi:MAG: hypothetical protein J0L71_12775, partial [Candidatus Accumulibacter sp.]|uniref:hypothetical protein n=1 Tax=Accumulibacter sp. TaxID=2053492 RepID=UPI001AC161A5
SASAGVKVSLSIAACPYRKQCSNSTAHYTRQLKSFVTYFSILQVELAFHSAAQNPHGARLVANCLTVGDEAAHSGRQSLPWRAYPLNKGTFRMEALAAF